MLRRAAKAPIDKSGRSFGQGGGEGHRQRNRDPCQRNLDNRKGDLQGGQALIGLVAHPLR